jgi:anti-anti-sigma factor
MADIAYNFSDLLSQDSNKKIVVLTVEGQLDESNVDNFAPKVYTKIEENTDASFIIDLEKVSYMNSKSIGYISDWYSKISAHGNKVVIAKAASNIKDVLNVVGLDKVIPMAQTMEEAKSLA